MIAARIGVGCILQMEIGHPLPGKTTMVLGRNIDSASRLPHLRTLSSWLLMGLVLQGCSSQQLYATGQSWQRQECSKINDAQERGRCMASASTSYEEYKRQAEAAKATK